MVRPQLIELEGFGSYLSDQVIDLAGVEFGVIIGENGAGKSSLFNGLMFALFGTPRVAGDIDSVIHQDTDRASAAVEFDFDGQTWKVTRQRVRGKRTSANLSRWNDDTGSWDVIADGAVRAVDDEITRLLRLDAATFAATVMLGQGDADRFAAATPAERKQLLSKIIGLERYQILADRAKEAAAQHHAAASEGLALIAQLDARLESSEDDALLLADAEANLAAAEAQEVQMAEKVQVLRTERDRVVGVLNDIGREVDSRKASLAQQRAGIERDLVDAQRRAVELSARVDRTKLAVADAQSKTQERHAAATALEQSLKDEGAAETEQETIQTQGESARGEVNAAEQRSVRLEAELAHLKERREMLADHQTDGLTDPGVCWVCEQNLDSATRARMITEVDESIQTCQELLNSARTDHAAAEAKVADLLARHRAAKTAKASLSEKVTALRAQVAEGEAAGRRLKELEDDLLGLEQELEGANGQVAVAERAVAGILPTAEDPGLIRLLEETAKAQEALALIGELAPHEARAGEAARLAREYTGTVARLTERCTQHDRDRQERVDIAADQETHAAEERTFVKLRGAFGRDGIPALIFEEVVETLGDLVNDALVGLSEGKMTVEMVTTRENKTGGERDTLDVNVVCPEGPRPFAALSGGEKQRVAVALRLGLSRLLANRHGTSIDFLAIDEGWGMLDPAGIAAMSECLNQLRTEFGLILTVSHIDAVKDGFATVIEVTKTAAGSEVTVR